MAQADLAGAANDCVTIGCRLVASDEIGRKKVRCVRSKKSCMDDKSHVKITRNGPYLVYGRIPLTIETIGTNAEGESWA
jgi:hypothetical protein